MSTDFLSQVSKPTLLLDEQKCRENISAIVKKADKLDIELRPHFKTHQSAEVGDWFRQAGVEKITTSSLSMARYFVDAGWTDICVAFPLNIREMALVNQLAEEISLTLIVTNTDGAKALSEQLVAAAAVRIKIDTGYHRSGIEDCDYEQIDQVIDILQQNPLIQIDGFLAHAGHSYSGRSSQQIAQVHQDSIAKLAVLKSHYRELKLKLSYGDTPSFSTQDDFFGVDELRPGNAVFYDVVQWQISSCDVSQVAVSLACPVVALYPEREELVVYGGAVHCSKDRMTIDEHTVFGLPVYLDENGWQSPIEGCFVKSLSQEHGIIHMPAEIMSQFNVGELIGILPVHSCLMADIHSQYLTLDSKVITKFRTY